MTGVHRSRADITLSFRSLILLWAQGVPTSPHTPWAVVALNLLRFLVHHQATHDHHKTSTKAPFGALFAVSLGRSSPKTRDLAPPRLAKSIGLRSNPPGENKRLTRRGPPPSTTRAGPAENP